MILKQIHFIFLVSIVCISANDFDNIPIDIQSKQVKIQMENFQLGSAFFYTELPDECSLGYTFSKNASKLEYRQNLAKELKPNDSLRILGVFETNGTVFRKVYDYKINANGQPEKQNTSPITKPCTTSEPRNTLNCEKSVTVINFDQYNCSNELIYTEKFDTFPKDAFTKEIRARTRTVEKEFVAFVDDDATCFVENGYLNLKAVWVYGTIKSFSVDNCTSKLNINRRTSECGPLYQNTQFSLPPVYSANLRSKFQFRFGRVDIRARMPRGNYLIPHLMLVPSGKDTEDSNLPHLRIAFSRGDSQLVDFHKIYIGGNVVYGGAYVNNGTELTEYIVGLSKARFQTFSAQFHTYSIIWRNNIIIFLFDDIAYGTITDKNILKDFDTECYLVLGLTAGGKHNFPDDSIFAEPKPLDLFIESKKQNRLTWQQPSLLIDWINVYSVGEQDPQFAVNK